METGNELPMTSMTVRPFWVIDTPRSPCAAFQTYRTYCSYHGLSSPYFAFMFARISAGTCLSPGERARRGWPSSAGTSGR